MRSLSEHLLGQGLGFPLQQTVSRLSSLELRLHDTQRLPGGEDGLSILYYGTKCQKGTRAEDGVQLLSDIHRRPT